MRKIVQIEISNKTLKDEERSALIRENLDEDGLIELTVLPTPKMEIRLENGTHIKVTDVLILQKTEVVKPDCIAFVD